MKFNVPAAFNIPLMSCLLIYNWANVPERNIKKFYYSTGFPVLVLLLIVNGSKCLCPLIHVDIYMVKLILLSYLNFVCCRYCQCGNVSFIFICFYHAGVSIAVIFIRIIEIFCQTSGNLIFGAFYYCTA